MRTIDADALIEFIENSYKITWKGGYEGGIKDACVEILEQINRMPTIEPAQQWIPCKEQGSGYINDKRLKNDVKNILITYETLRGRRYVKQVLSDRGHIPKKVGGVIVAWREAIEPYKEDEA